MASFLITGGAGFIGSHLAETALLRGHSVRVIDNLSSGVLENIATLRAHPRFEFLEASAADSPVLQDWVDAVDVVFHLAATVGVFNVVQSPATTIENNVNTTEAVLRAARNRKRRVIVASTSEVYGKSTAQVFREDDDLVLGPSRMGRWGYAASKLVDEFLALAYWREYQLPTVVVRPFNTIGPRQVGHYGMVVPRFIGQALAGKNLTVYGNGRQTRSFTYVQDVVQWLLRLAELDTAVGEVFNLGNPGEVSIEELARRIIELAGSQSRIELIEYAVAYRAGFEDMARRVPDISKVVGATGHAPCVDLDEALQRTLAWFRHRALREES